MVQSVHGEAVQEPDGLPQTLSDAFGEVVGFQVLQCVHEALQGVLVAVFRSPEAEQLGELLT